VKLAADNQEMLRADLDSENETIRNYLERVKQCELLSEYATAETIREILSMSRTIGSHSPPP
jgi:bacterioferritin